MINEGIFVLEVSTIAVSCRDQSLEISSDPNHLYGQLERKRLRLVWSNYRVFEEKTIKSCRLTFNKFSHTGLTNLYRFSVAVQVCVCFIMCGLSGHTAARDFVLPLMFPCLVCIHHLTQHGIHQAIQLPPQLHPGLNSVIILHIQEENTTSSFAQVGAEAWKVLMTSQSHMGIAGNRALESPTKYYCSQQPTFLSRERIKQQQLILK